MDIDKIEVAAITSEHLQTFNQHFSRAPRYRQALNALAKNPVSAIALNRQIVTSTDHVFSHMLKSAEPTAQEKTGRCWLFAGLNTFRMEAKKRESGSRPLPVTRLGSESRIS